MAGLITAGSVIGGELIFSLTDGTILNVGNVQGSRGVKGEIGAPGPSGDDGEDGLNFLSGPRMPTPEDGRQGEMWYDTSAVTIWGPKGADMRWPGPVYIREADVPGVKAASGGQVAVAATPFVVAGDPTGDVFGEIKMFAVQIPALPTGWQVCDGSVIDATLTTARAVLGNTVPDLRDRFIRGESAGNPAGTYQDATTGEPTGGLTLAGWDAETAPQNYRVIFAVYVGTAATNDEGDGASDLYLDLTIDAAFEATLWLVNDAMDGTATAVEPDGWSITMVTTVQFIFDTDPATEMIAAAETDNGDGTYTYVLTQGAGTQGLGIELDEWIPQYITVKEDLSGRTPADLITSITGASPHWS